ncbi:MAG: GNAT family N-acetyltransferase [Colwellia sp.]|nr:GNAT family N-acetyltransferase [Colwellia sp.]
MRVCLAEMKYLASYQQYLAECFSYGLQKYQAAALEPKSHLENIIAHEQGHKLPSNTPATSSYFCLINDEVVGTIRYRRGNSPFIEQVIGHTGYDTKPSSRGKGVAKFMLSWLQEQVLTEHIIVTCEYNNIASQKVIESCGGKFINQIYSNEKAAKVLRFQLPPKEEAKLSDQAVINPNIDIAIKSIVVK